MIENKIFFILEKINKFNFFHLSTRSDCSASGIWMRTQSTDRASCTSIKENWSADFFTGNPHYLARSYDFKEKSVLTKNFGFLDRVQSYSYHILSLSPREHATRRRMSGPSTVGTCFPRVLTLPDTSPEK